MKKFFIMSIGVALMLVGTFGFSVTPGTSVLVTRSSVISVTAYTSKQLHLASPPSGASGDVCSKHQPVGYAHCNVVLRSSGALASVANATPALTLGDNGAYSPSFLQSAYNVASLSAAGNGGIGQIVAIVDAYSNPNLASDLAYYRHYFNLPACNVGPVSATASGCNFQQVNEQGALSPLPSSNISWGLEAAVDVEMVSALCPNCQILVVDASSASLTDLGASVNTAVSLGATVVSNSYGSPEFSSENTLSDSYYLHPGVAIVAAAGDAGYGVQFPAASPNVIAVGGTTLLQNTNTGTRNGSETAWSGSGSGCSLYEAKPTWQRDTGCSNRSVADVSAVADPNTGVWVYDTFGASGLYEAGGTSVATALVSALFALSAPTSPTKSNPASYLYSNASSLYHVTQGTNANCGTYLCDATQSINGYNGPTGLGTAGATPNSVAALSPSSSTNTPTASAIATDSTFGPPTAVEALPGNGEAVVGWTPPANHGGTKIASYVVSDGSAQSCTYVVSINGANSCTVTGLINGKSYRFSVTAMNATSASPASLDSAPVVPTDEATVTQVATGYDNACVLYASGAVSCWGFNNAGQLGNGSTKFATTPASVTGITSATQIAVSANYACALLSGGTISCWGDNTYGQLGNDTVAGSSTSPVVVRGITNATQLSLSSTYACAVLIDGSISCWGSNQFGQLGNGSTINSSTPTSVSNIVTAVSVSTGPNHACATLTSGALLCWGSGNYGELGNGTTASSLIPVAVSGLTNVTRVGIGYNNTCALLATGTVTCWGYNGEGELGNGTYVNSLTPVSVSGLANVTALSTSAYGSCAVTLGTLTCWGYHSAGQLSFGATMNSNTPVVVSKISGVTQVDLGYNYNYTCVVLNGSSVGCWDDGAMAPTSIGVALTTQAPFVKTVKVHVKSHKVSAATDADSSRSTH